MYNISNEDLAHYFKIARDETSKENALAAISLYDDIIDVSLVGEITGKSNAETS